MPNRKINIELIRVFAIFMTVMIHISNFYINKFGEISNFDFLISVTYNSFSRICVPLFFMVSGIFLIGRDFDKRKYLKRIFKFTLILVIWSVIYYLSNSGFDFKNLCTVFFTSLFNANATSRHLWFLYAIIGIYIALPFINSMCKNLTREQENLFLILWLAFSGFVVIFVPLARFFTKTNIDVTYPIPIINSAYYLGYFISGHILYKVFSNIKPDKKKNLICLLGYIVPTLITIFTTFFISIRNGRFYTPLTWYRSIFIVLSAISVFILIIINEEKIKNKLILKLSKHSFGIYLIHMLVFNILKTTGIMTIPTVVSIPLVTAIVYMISLAISFVISKIPILNKYII